MPFNVELGAGIKPEDRYEQLVGIDLPLELITERESEFPLLRGVDPYDNTYFNTWQMRFHLIEELEALSRLLEPARRATIERVLELARAGEQRPGQYLVFVGD